MDQTRKDSSFLPPKDKEASGHANVPHRPELLAPAGGHEQFFAAIHAGADAVYLGLKDFNARRRAENFELGELGYLVAYAAKYKAKVLIALNVLIKEAEFAQIIVLLERLVSAGVYALIVQDLGLAYLIKEFFPTLRLHASTQLAVHNYEGVKACCALGFSRVVLARELTILEISKIKKKLQAENIPVEIEVFCHGSLCYSYSGLCFFSGTEGGRSGNRGECAYTCRKPYKILSEPGHGFLFSMKDLSTFTNIEDLIHAGVDTLKIEGRKKDAQYVLSTVQSYKRKLDGVCGAGASIAKEFEQSLTQRDVLQDLKLSFSREFTSLFTNNRYHENVIDLNNPTHLGIKIGTVAKLLGNKIGIQLLEAVQVYDGLRIEGAAKTYHTLPQHGKQNDSMKDSLEKSRAKYAEKALQFSLRSMWQENKKVFTAEKGQEVFIEVPEDHESIKIGDHVYKSRSVDLKQLAEKLSKALGNRVNPITATINLVFTIEQASEHLLVEILGFRQQELFFQTKEEWPLIISEQGGLEEVLKKDFHYLGSAQIQCNVSVHGGGQFFVPLSWLKKVKRTLATCLVAALNDMSRERSQLISQVYEARLKDRFVEKEQVVPQRALKTDQQEHIYSMLSDLDFFSQSGISELIFEAKRSRLKLSNIDKVLDQIKIISRDLRIPVRIALPMVFRAWDKPFLQHFLRKSLDTGIHLFEIANIGGWQFLQDISNDHKAWNISADFSLYALNSYAPMLYKSLNISRATLSIEDDQTNIHHLLSAWPKDVEAQLIIYKDVPLFVAESCSLTALHNGCPGSDTCGYRSLEIEDDAGERFIVAHEACRSVVYGQRPYSLAGHWHLKNSKSIHWYRFDFLYRDYPWNQVKEIITAARDGRTLKQSHTANIYKKLL